MFFVYILYSSNYERYYVGQTNDLSDRLRRHNSGYVRSTKYYAPWELVYFEEFETRAQAMKRESALKGLKSSFALRKLVEASR